MNASKEFFTRREFLKRIILTGVGTSFAPLIAYACEEAVPRQPRIAYYCNGEIHVSLPGREGKPITKGHWDFKPSWSKTGDMLVFFRRLKSDPDVSKWLTAICIINVDGTGFHQLTDGTYTEFNPTWTRDGKNIPVWNRKDPKTGNFCIMASKVGGKPGEELPLTDPRYFAWVHSALSDGRLFVTANPPKLGFGYYLMTPKPGGEPKFERIECELLRKGFLDRVSVSPDEKMICFEFQPWSKGRTMAGRTLFIAEFNAEKRVIKNPKPFANEEGKPLWFGYPRWIDGGKAVIYHACKPGNCQLYVYRLEDRSTKRVSTDPKADYRYPCGEDAPC